MMYRWLFLLATGMAIGAGVNRTTENGLRPGMTWNEARRWTDSVSGLPIMQLTTRGIYNQGPTVHYLTAFPGGGDTVIFATIRDGISALCSGNISTGEIKLHWIGPKFAEWNPTEPAGTIKACPNYIEGINLAASPRHRLVAVIVRMSGNCQLIDLDSNHVTEIVRRIDHPDEWITTPIFSNDGKILVCPTGYQHDIGRMTYWAYNVNCGTDRKVLRNMAWGQPHVIPHPLNPECWMVASGMPWRMSAESDARNKSLRQPKWFVFNVLTGESRPVLPRDKNKNIAHISWNWRGDRIIYHGVADGGGMYVGVMTHEGTVIWEYVYRNWHPKRNGLSHIAADTVGDYIVDDGMAVKNQLSMLDYSCSGSDGPPVVIPLAVLKNDWKLYKGQMTHPHPAFSPNGNKIVFYHSADGQVHVLVVDISSLRHRLNNEKKTFGEHR